MCFQHVLVGVGGCVVVMSTHAHRPPAVLDTAWEDSLGFVRGCSPLLVVLRTLYSTGIREAAPQIELHRFGIFISLGVEMWALRLAMSNGPLHKL